MTAAGIRCSAFFRCFCRQNDASPDMLSSNISSKFDLNTNVANLEVPIFSYRELENATNSFHPDSRIGNYLFYAKLRQGHQVVIRLLDKKGSLAQVVQFKNEVEILTRLRHHNLVSLYAYTSFERLENYERLLLVYEFIPNGTVAQHLYGHNRKKNGGGLLLSWPIRLRIAIDTASALAYLHASKVVHRDLKSDSILLDKNYRAKVADFGISRIFPDNVTHVSTSTQGNAAYCDPEYLRHYQLSYKSDVFSFGIFLVELISSTHPVQVIKDKHITLADFAVNKIRSNALNELVDPSLGFDSNFMVRTTILMVLELAVQCLRLERELRPSMDTVLEVLQGIVSEMHKVGSVSLPLGIRGCSLC